jgi:hypothetical protein
MIVAEIKALEGGPQSIGTKPATEFTKEPLKGLWHKHFFSAHFVAHNLLDQLSGGRLKALVEKMLDPKKHPVITTELINQLSHEVAIGTFEKREAQGKLTGERIVFAKQAGQNYLLVLVHSQHGRSGCLRPDQVSMFSSVPVSASAAVAALVPNKALQRTVLPSFGRKARG